MVNAFNVTGAKKEHLEEFESCNEAVAMLLKNWNEEPTGPQSFIIENDEGFMVATMVRDFTDPEIAHVWTVGKGSSKWKVTHLLNNDGLLFIIVK